MAEAAGAAAAAAKRNVLVVGSGGREHAIARTLAADDQVAKILVAPGNGGTEGCLGKVTNAACDVKDHAAVVALCKANDIDLVVVGPEVPLADGIADSLTAEGIKVFGPSKAAAKLEASKAHSKDFMQRHNIPTAAYANFTEYEKAAEYVRTCGTRVVIKASGLAAGKGVLIPETTEEAIAALEEVMLQKSFGTAGDVVVVEEFMEGQEASVLAFCDGTDVFLMPAAQDHKRVFDGDKGLNTGGMGAYAPAPAATPAVMRYVRDVIVQPTIDGLRKEGTPFVGCLFTGLMLTPKGGVKVVEFNVRFGDPETEVVLPLLDQTKASLYDIFAACADGKLKDVTPSFHEGRHAATVFMASPGYPKAYPKGLAITGVEKAQELEDVTVFHAGTKRADGGLATSGGRVLTVTGTGASLREAIDKAYAGVALVSFEGAHYRKDIAHRALLPENWMPKGYSPYGDYTRGRPLRLGVLGSTRGTDMQAIIDAIEAGTLNATIAVCCSNKKKSGILDRAAKHGISTHHLVCKKGTSREDYDAKVSRALAPYAVDLLLCIGYMRIVSAPFCKEWENRIMNVHPSLLPKFAGGMDLNVHQEVLDAGESESGCTVHWITEEVDGGGHVVQKSCKIEEGETADSLKAKVQKLEGEAFIEAIEKFARGDFK